MIRRWLVVALVCLGSALTAVPSRAESHVIDVVNPMAFVPAVLDIQVGDTVTFVKENTGFTAHNVRSDAFTNGCTFGPTCFRSGNPVTSAFTLGPITFDQVGTFPFFCEAHGTAGGQPSQFNMAGRIVVQSDEPPPPPPPPPPPTQDAGTIRFTNANYNRAEGIGLAAIQVERVSGDDGAVGVSFDSIAGGSATAGVDYTEVSGLLSWADQEDGTKTFNVPIDDDDDDESNEFINLSIFTPTGGATLGSPSDAILTIVDNDSAGSPGTIQFTATSFDVAETSAQATVSVSRSGGNTGAASVEYDTSDGTADAGQDYTAVGGTLNWGNGDAANKSFQVPILDDIDSEGDETIGVALSQASGAGLGSPSAATVTIHDNETVPECADGDFQSCLLGRFLVRIHWRQLNGNSGEGRATKLTDSAAAFEFFEPGNVEVVVKIKDGCGFLPGNPIRNFWPFIAGLTNVRVEITIIDTESGVMRRFFNALGQPFFTPAADSPDGKTNPPGAIQATTVGLGAFNTCDG